MSARRTPSSPPPKSIAPPAEISQQVEMMERLLRAQLDGWRRALLTADAMREALRRADAGELDRLGREQQQVVRTLATLDQQRERLALAMQKALAPKAAGVLPLSNLLIAAAADAQQQQVLSALATELRSVVERTRQRSSIVRDAAESLGRHIAGIQQTVHSALSRARVYGRRGNLALGNAAPAAVDVRS